MPMKSLRLPGYRTPPSPRTRMRIGSGPDSPKTLSSSGHRRYFSILDIAFSAFNPSSTLPAAQYLLRISFRVLTQYLIVNPQGTSGMDGPLSVPRLVSVADHLAARKTSGGVRTCSSRQAAEKSDPMPVSFSVAEHPATSVNLTPDVVMGLTSEQILARAVSEYQGCSQMLQFSLEGVEGDGRDFITKIPGRRLIPDDNNGFVQTVVTAYNRHYALVLRPDDVWLAILCQFNFYVNANAELLRASFVTYAGKRELRVVNEGTRWTLDFGSMARQMSDLVDQNISDPTLRAWALPTFSTTTDTDRTVASVLLMATLREYVAMRTVGTRCGIPRVTLEGEKVDWVDILGRLEKLKEYGVETIAWYHLLHPIIARIVAAFDAPESEENVAFWSKIVHHHMKSGVSYYSGWLNAFTDVVSTEAPESLSVEKFWATYTKETSADLVFDGTPYHRLNTENVSPGYATVNVTLDDNGALFDCEMIAGTVGTRVSSSGDTSLSVDGKDDTVWPVAGWWMFAKKSEEE
ncbi:hypothetical protein K438DRAFT_1928022 [Mycena galopus ATCC 62051]|nr:hypothetical protein K438DRAFT_1928022 [Mycena galopus ATCC 62051]